MGTKHSSNSAEDHNSSEESSQAGEIKAAGKAKWWQLLILYPTLATSIVAAVPTLIELYRSNKYGVEFGESTQAKERERLFLKNMTCTVEPFDWYRAANNVQVDATICVSGDVLVRLQSPFNSYAYGWVSVDQLLARITGSPSSLQGLANFVLPTASAHASAQNSGAFLGEKNVELAQAGRLICQFSPQQGIMVFRYQGPAGCYEDVVNMYTGQVISRRGAPCSC